MRGPSWESDLPLNRSLASRHRQSPERRAKAAGLFRTYLALNQGVKELHDEIENELRESIK